MRTAFLGLFLVACVGQEAPTVAPAPSPPPPSLVAPPEPSSCVADCEHRNQMRAIGADMIRRDCEDECSRDAG